MITPTVPTYRTHLTPREQYLKGKEQATLRINPDLNHILDTVTVAKHFPESVAPPVRATRSEIQADLGAPMRVTRDHRKHYRIYRGTTYIGKLEHLDRGRWLLTIQTTYMTAAHEVTMADTAVDMCEWFGA